MWLNLKDGLLSILDGPAQFLYMFILEVHKCSAQTIFDKTHGHTPRCSDARFFKQLLVKARLFFLFQSEIDSFLKVASTAANGCVSTKNALADCSAKASFSMMVQLRFGYDFFSKSRISVSKTTSSGIGASSSAFFIHLEAIFNAMKITNARMIKSITF